jgi:hypothetical protein
MASGLKTKWFFCKAAGVPVDLASVEWRKYRPGLKNAYWLEVEWPGEVELPYHQKPAFGQEIDCWLRVAVVSP